MKITTDTVTKTVTRVVEEEVEEDVFILSLNKHEARVLRTVIGRVGGLFSGTPRPVISRMCELFDDEDVEPYSHEIFQPKRDVLMLADNSNRIIDPERKTL